MSSRLPSRHKKGRPHSVKPYERTQASKKPVGFVEKVRQYLPSWLSLSWMTSSSDALETTASENVTVEEELDEEILDVPGPSGLLSTRQNSENSSIETGVYVRSPLQRTSPQVNGDDQSENSETSASTSGCSSLAPSHQERKKQVFKGLAVSQSALEEIKSDLGSKRHSIFKDNRNEVAEEVNPIVEDENEDDIDTESKHGADTTSTHTSLWSEDDYVNSSVNCMPGQPGKKRFSFSRPQPSGSSKRPCFSLSCYGAPGSFQTNSPFYDGNTTFGGASAYRRSRIVSPTPYQPPRSVSSAQKKQECMSSTAKLILNALEKMSTPLSDARRIPSTHQSSEFALSFTPARYRQMQYQKDGPPKTDRAVPFPCTVGRSLQSLRRFDKRVSPSKNTSSRADDKTFSSSKVGGKMRTTNSQSLHYSKPKDTEFVEELSLPSVPLPISTLPSFSFKIPSSSSLSSTPTTQPFSFSSFTSTTLCNVSPSSQQQKNPSPKESLPQQEQPSSALNPPNSPAGFSFASPRQTGEPAPHINRSIESSSPSFKFSVPTLVSVEDQEKTTNRPTFMFTSKVSTPPVTSFKKNESSKDLAKPTTELIQGGSVLDFLGIPRSQDQDKGDKSDKLKGDATDLRQMFKPAAGTWECSVCLVRNGATDVKCIACETVKLNSSETTVTSAAPATGTGTLFKLPPSSWECPKCMINNKEELMKCSACETLKPSLTPAVESVATKTLSSKITTDKSVGGFGGTLYKPPSKESWECDTCLVRNTDLQMKCQACETPRVSNVPTKDIKSTFGGFQFAKTETNSQPTFKFGFSGTGTTTAVSNFVFGSPAVTIASTATFKFGDSKAAVVSKPNSEGTVKFGYKSDSTDGPTKPSGFVFGAAKTECTDKKDTIDSDLQISKPSEANVLSSAPIDTVPAVTANSKNDALVPSIQTVASESKFSFGSASMCSTGFKFGGSAQINSAASISAPSVTLGKLSGTNETEETAIASVASKTEAVQAGSVSITDTSDKKSDTTTPGGFKFTFSDNTSKGNDANTFSFKNTTPNNTVVPNTTVSNTVTTTASLITTTTKTTTPSGGFLFPLKKDQSFSFSSTQSDKESSSFKSVSTINPTNTLTTQGVSFISDNPTAKSKEQDPAQAKPSLFRSTGFGTPSTGIPFSFASTATSTTTSSGPAPVFSFSSNISAAPSKPFVFGGTTSKSSSTSTPGTFSFGTSQGHSNPGQPTPVFGSLAPPSQAPTGVAAPMFSFGPSPLNPTSSNPPATGSSAPIFRFGSNTPLTASAGTPFGGFGANQPAQSTGSMFPSTGQAPLFQFGAPSGTTTTPSTLFRFGTNQESGPGLTSVPQQQPQPPPFGAFTGTPSLTGSGTAPPPFGAINPSTQFPILGSNENPFNATGASSGAAQGRKIRRAVRRVNKK